jgi:hypothetical protein
LAKEGLSRREGQIRMGYEQFFYLYMGGTLILGLYLTIADFTS